MSTVGVSCGKASSSCQVQRFGSFTFPSIEKSHRSRGVCGVGPAESTGKPRSRYCPGGSRPATSPWWRRPRKAREMNPSLMFSPPDLFLLCSCCFLLYHALCEGLFGQAGQDEPYLAHQKVLLDERWLSALLSRPSSSPAWQRCCPPLPPQGRQISTSKPENYRLRKG